MVGVDCCYDDDDAAADVVEPLDNMDWAGRRYKRYANLIRGFRLAFNYIRTGYVDYNRSPFE